MRSNFLIGEPVGSCLLSPPTTPQAGIEFHGMYKKLHFLDASKR